MCGQSVEGTTQCQRSLPGPQAGQNSPPWINVLHPRLCEQYMAMHGFGQLVMLIGLPVSDLGRRFGLSNSRNDRINISLHRRHYNAQESVNPELAKMGIFERFQNYHVKDDPWITTMY